MMKIQILGSGCDKCRKLAANAKLAAEQLNLSCEIEKVEDINQITAFGVMMTPALVVNGKVVSSGKVLTSDEIAAVLSAPVCDCNGQCASAEAKKTESSAPCCCGKPAESPVPCCCGSHSEKQSASCCCGDGKKRIMTILLLLFVVASIIFMVIRKIADHVSSKSSSVGIEQVNPADRK